MKTFGKTPAEEYLRVLRVNLEMYKGLADKAFAQLKEEDYHGVLDEESNTIAILIQHMSGNMVSRFTDFLSSDGEKPNRDRDSEFIDRQTDPKHLLEIWEKGWKVLFGVLDGLSTDDLLRTVYIRNEPHSVLEALNRQVAHYSYHVGQIVFLAKHFRNKTWQSLSIPRKKS
jgi:hypothetical protein